MIEILGRSALLTAALAFVPIWSAAIPGCSHDLDYVAVEDGPLGMDDELVFLAEHYVGPVARASESAAPSTHGPDLTVDDIDVSQITGDWQDLLISGTLRVTVRNAGDLAVDNEFYLTVFEDLDRDGAPDPTLDAILAVILQSSQPPLEAANVSVPISTTVPFRDSPISVYVDSTNVVAEFSERNNLGSTSWLCRARDDENVRAPDLTVSRIVATVLLDGATVDLSARSGNGGGAAAPSGVPVQFTAGSFAGRGATVGPLAPGQFETVRVTWQYPQDFAGMVHASIVATPGYQGDCNSANDSHSTWVDLRHDEGPLYLPSLRTVEGYGPAQ